MMPFRTELKFRRNALNQPIVSHLNQRISMTSDKVVRTVSNNNLNYVRSWVDQKQEMNQCLCR
jgi:hypothetical protein